MPVRSEDVPSLADALQIDAMELRTMAGIQYQPAEPKAEVIATVVGIVTEETVTDHVLRWQVGDDSMPIDDLSREDLLGAVRSLFEANGKLRAEFDMAMGEIANMYERKISSLHHILAAQVELEIRDAVRDKMETILEAVMAEVERRSPMAVEMGKDSKESTNNGH